MPTTFEIAAGTKLFLFVTRARIDTLERGIIIKEAHYQVIPASESMCSFVYRIDGCENKFIRKIGPLENFPPMKLEGFKQFLQFQVEADGRRYSRFFYLYNEMNEIWGGRRVKRSGILKFRCGARARPDDRNPPPFLVRSTISREIDCRIIVQLAWRRSELFVFVKGRRHGRWWGGKPGCELKSTFL